MDKRKVITAYRRGFITIHECAQILGVDSLQVMGMMEDCKPANMPPRVKQPVNG